MDRFEAWLAAMPVQEVRDRIDTLRARQAALQRELDVLLLLEQRHVGQSRPDALTPSSAMPVLKIPNPDTDHVKRERKLSPERAAIIESIRQNPEGLSPVEIARRLDKEPNPIQTTLSRMARVGQVHRVGQGLYRLPQTAPAPDLLSVDGSETGDQEDDTP